MGSVMVMPAEDPSSSTDFISNSPSGLNIEAAVCRFIVIFIYSRKTLYVLSQCKDRIMNPRTDAVLRLSMIIDIILPITMLLSSFLSFLSEGLALWCAVAFSFLNFLYGFLRLQDALTGDGYGAYPPARRTGQYLGLLLAITLSFSLTAGLLYVGWLGAIDGSEKIGCFFFSAKAADVFYGIPG